MCSAVVSAQVHDLAQQSPTYAASCLAREYHCTEPKRQVLNENEGLVTQTLIHNAVELSEIFPERKTNRALCMCCNLANHIKFEYSKIDGTDE